MEFKHSIVKSESIFRRSITQGGFTLLSTCTGTGESSMGHLIHGLGSGDENSWAFRLGRNGTRRTPPLYNLQAHYGYKHVKLK